VTIRVVGDGAIKMSPECSPAMGSKKRSMRWSLSVGVSA
jgi:hypothetical protein